MVSFAYDALGRFTSGENSCGYTETAGLTVLNLFVLFHTNNIFGSKYGFSVPFWGAGRNKLKREIKRLQSGISCLLYTKGGM